MGVGSARADAQHAHTHAHAHETPPVSPDWPDCPDWLAPDDWRAYRRHRCEKGSPMGRATAAMVIADLEKAKSYGHDPSALLREAIHEGWIGCVFQDRHFRPPEPTRERAAPGGGRERERARSPDPRVSEWQDIMAGVPQVLEGEAEACHDPC